MDSMNFDDFVTKKVIRLEWVIDEFDDLDVLVDVLKKSKVLEELKLGDNHLTLADGKFTDAVANNRTLKGLWLQYNNIGIEGAKRLADALKVNTTLKLLNLDDNEIGDEGAKYIADALMENETLEEISLDKNKIGDDGAKSLANCFMVNQSIREVLLGNNNISDSDNGAQKLIEALKWNYGIEYLNMRGNPMSDHVKAEIDDLLEDPKRMVPNAQMKHVREEIERKDEAMKHVREEVTTLKTELATKERRIDIMTTAIRFPLEQLRNIIDPVDLTGEENEPFNKRPRMESTTTKSNLAIVHQQNLQHTQTLVRVKQEKNTAETEKNTAETNLKIVQEEKEAAETSLNDTREDLEDANETVQQQLLATDIWQRRFDELAALVAGQVDGASLSEIRNRTLASGS